jgi:hypothetical protein
MIKNRLLNHLHFLHLKGWGQLNYIITTMDFMLVIMIKCITFSRQAFTDKIVRRATTLEMEAFQKVNKGRFHINQMADGQFEIKVTDSLPGGGPILGGFMYWTTKVLCYSIGAIGLSASVATAAPAVVTAVGVIAGGTGTATATAGAATFMAGGVAEMAIVGAASTAGAITTIAVAPVAGAVGAVIDSTAGATVIVAGTCSTAAAATTLTSLAVTAASLGGATIGGVALTEVAALTTTVVVPQATATAGAAGGAELIVGDIEAFATLIGTFCGMLPTP